MNSSQKHALKSLARAGRTPQLLARKCRAVLLASEGTANNAIAQQTGLSRPTVVATRAAFAGGGVEGLRRRQKRKRSHRVLTPELEQKILDTTLKTRPPDATHWRVRTLACHLGVTRTLGMESGNVTNAATPGGRFKLSNVDEKSRLRPLTAPPRFCL